MSQNLAIANADNLVVLNFNGAFLSTADDIKVIFGAEIYTKLLNPTIVIVDSDTQLSLNLSDTTEVGKIFVTIKRFDSGSTYGSDITSMELGNLDQIVVAIGTQLIIEDGSVVADANSLTTDAEFISYANLRGFSVPSTEPERDALQILAMDYLFGVEDQIQGERTSADQELPVPRVGMYARNKNISSNEIPKDWKKAQLELALQAAQTELLVNASVQNIASERVDVLETSYFSGGSWASVQTGRADAYLDPYKRSGGGVRLVRI